VILRHPEPRANRRGDVGEVSLLAPLDRPAPLHVSDRDEPRSRGLGPAGTMVAEVERAPVVRGDVHGGASPALAHPVDHVDDSGDRVVREPEGLEVAGVVAVVRVLVRLAEGEEQQAGASELEVARGERRGESIRAEVAVAGPRERARPVVEEIGHLVVLAQERLVLPERATSADDERVGMERGDADEVRPRGENGDLARRDAPLPRVVGQRRADGAGALVVVARGGRMTAHDLGVARKRDEVRAARAHHRAAVGRAEDGPSRPSQLHQLRHRWKVGGSRVQLCLAGELPIHAHENVLPARAVEDDHDGRAVRSGAHASVCFFRFGSGRRPGLREGGRCERRGEHRHRASQRRGASPASSDHRSISPRERRLPGYLAYVVPRDEASPSSVARLVLLGKLGVNAPRRARVTLGDPVASVSRRCVNTGRPLCCRAR
jgi:hypothetical protein